MSPYILIEADSSICPECHQPVYLLTTDTLSNNPSFFICFRCKFVGHVGVGRVTHKPDEDNLPEGQVVETDEDTALY